MFPQFILNPLLPLLGHLFLRLSTVELFQNRVLIESCPLVDLGLKSTHYTSLVMLKLIVEAFCLWKITKHSLVQSLNFLGYAGSDAIPSFGVLVQLDGEVGERHTGVGGF